MKTQVTTIIISLVLIIITVGCSVTSFDQLETPKLGDQIAIMKTNMGDIHIRLFKSKAPDAVENFTVHASNGYYDNMIFHRVIDGFMIQTGDPTGTGTGGESIWGSPFPDYFTGKLHHFRGAVSMANSGYNTNKSKFFIVQARPMKMNTNAVQWLKSEGFDDKIAEIYLEIGGTPWLDNGHTMEGSNNDGHMIFGQVYKGMDVVDAIAAVPVDAKNDKPLDDIVLYSIEITEYQE